MIKRVLVAGASGFVGSAVVERLITEGYRVIGLSRHMPVSPVKGADYIPLDLLDRQACLKAADNFNDITHCVYAAVNETPGDLVASWSDPEHAARNGKMFINLMDALLNHHSMLRHVTVVHGTKAYAVHRMKQPPVPLKESRPRPDNDDFYFRQEDCLWGLAARRQLSWTILRAQIVVGGGRGSNLNGLLALCVFACIRREAGLDLPLPGGDSTYAVIEMTDVELLANAVAWSLVSSNAKNQIFNVTNGDQFTWPDLWPAIAKEIGLPVGSPSEYSIQGEIEKNANIWKEIVNKYCLKLPESPKEFLGESAALADFALGAKQNVITSTIKIRQAGFADCIDSEQSVVSWIRRWRTEGLLPPL